MSLRRYLHWIAVALLAIFAPVVAVAIYAAARVRTRQRSVPAPDVSGGETVIAFPAKSLASGRPVEPCPERGAVILEFRLRTPSAVPLDHPPALTGSR